MRAKLLALGAVLVSAVALSGQAQRGPATLDDVVNEIRALRADLKASSAVSAQTQMLTARLSLQEQRLAVLSNQRNDVSARLSVETRLRAEAEAQVKTFEDSKDRNASLDIPRAELENMANMFRRNFAQHREAEQQLRAQESDLSAQIVAEQNRWQDFNNRLDELERSLK